MARASCAGPLPPSQFLYGIYYKANCIFLDFLIFVLRSVYPFCLFYFYGGIQDILWLYCIHKFGIYHQTVLKALCGVLCPFAFELFFDIFRKPYYTLPILYF